MNEQFQVRPNFREGPFPGIVENRLDQGQHPRGHAGEVADVRLGGGLDNRLQLAFPLIHEDDALARHPKQLHQRMEVLQQDRR